MVMVRIDSITIVVAVHGVSYPKRRRVSRRIRNNHRLPSNPPPPHRHTSIGDVRIAPWRSYIHPSLRIVMTTMNDSCWNTSDRVDSTTSSNSRRNSHHRRRHSHRSHRHRSQKRRNNSYYRSSNPPMMSDYYHYYRVLVTVRRSKDVP